MKKFFFIIILFFSCFSYAQEKLTVLLDWFPNAGHAPLFVALDQGFFSEQGLQVDLIGPANPADPPKLVAAGKADIAITYQPQHIEHVNQGLPLIRMGTLVNEPLDCLVALKSSGINSISDLKNKRIGYSAGSMHSVALQTMLKSQGLTLKDVELVNVNYSLTQALLSQKVDAVTGMMRTFETVQLEIMNKPFTMFFPEKFGVPTYSELIFVVHKTKINDPRFPKFLKALKKGRDYLIQYPETSWIRFVKNHPELNDKINHRAWFVYLPYFAKDPFIYHAKEWQTFIQFMYDNKLIQNILPLQNYTIELKKD